MSLTVMSILFPAFAAVATVALTPLARTLALRRGRVSDPREDRWHRRPTPAVGGAPLFIGFGGAVALAIAFGAHPAGWMDPPARAVLPLAPHMAILLAATGMFLLGLVDDQVQVRPVTKLVGQIAAAALLITSGIGVWLTGVYVVDVAISLLWFVGVTNALNLLDNMDGLAGGVGAIAAGFMGVTFGLEGQAELAVIAFSLMGALIGFLVHNYPPARVFMGDSGSLFLGVTLAGMALAPAPGLSRGLVAVVAVPAIVLAIPILDTTFVTIARMLEGRPVAEGGRDHTSHGLVALGVSEERALWILWSLAAAGGVVGLFVRTVERTTALVLGGVLVAGLSLLGAFLLLQRMQRAEAGAAENGESVQRYRRLRELHERFPLLLIGLDVFLIGLAYYAAYVIRWDADQLPAELPYFRSTLVIVIAAKVAAFAAAGVYRPRLRFFGLSDSLRVVRANLLGTLLTVSILLLVQRVGLSRGVVLVDLLVCTALTGAARFSFRFMEGALQRWSSMGVPVVVLGAVDDIGPAFSWIVDRRLAGLRPVALADPSAASPLTHFKGYPVYGRPDALARALRGTEAHAVVLVEGERSQEARRALDEYLETHGSVDAFVVRCTIERLRVAGPGAAVPHPAD